MATLLKSRIFIKRPVYSYILSNLKFIYKTRVKNYEEKRDKLALARRNSIEFNSTEPAMRVTTGMSVVMVLLVAVQLAQFTTTSTETSECNCVLPIRCPAHFYDSSNKKCLIGKQRGICCTTGQDHTNSTNFGKGRAALTDLSEKMVKLLAQHAESKMVEVKKMSAATDRPKLAQGSPSFSHARNNRVFDADELNRVMGAAEKALEIALATRALRDSQELSHLQMELGSLSQDLRSTPLGHACGPLPDCPLTPYKYRRIDGACNNGANTVWGGAMSPYVRLLPPYYQDGVWSPRLSVTGRPLRSPREISYTVILEGDYPHADYTQMVMQFGQFMSHDITQSIDHTLANGTSISCCEGQGHFACMPIEVPKEDPFYAVFNKRCINFVRSVMAPRPDCTLGYGQQMNRVSHFLDCSMVYGATPQQSLALRTMEGGRLRIFNDFGRELMPLSKDKGACEAMEEGNACFEAGDGRVNQMITLVAMHTLFLREHNRIAKTLSQMNPLWDDDKIFLESRRILVAQFQVIVYKEFLPALLGEETMGLFGIQIPDDGQYSLDYDETIEPSVTNEFAAAAFRFGHSTVHGLIKIYGINKVEEMISIPEAMFKPGRMRKRDFFDQILSTLSTENIQQVDNHMSDTLTRYMFRAGNPFGVDLAALNIQRGRDHGLKPYNDYRQLVGLPRYKSFMDFGPQVGPKLAKVYDSVDDVDLWIGGLVEPKPQEFILGPTFRDIIADQFVRLKKGDRYFFDRPASINPGHFTQNQLIQLRQASLSRLVCDNSDGFLLARQAPNAFKTPGVLGNEFVECSDPKIPTVNLFYWKDF